MREFRDKPKFLLSSQITAIVGVYAAQLFTIQQRCIAVIRIICNNNFTFPRVHGQMFSKALGVLSKPEDDSLL